MILICPYIFKKHEKCLSQLLTCLFVFLFMLFFNKNIIVALAESNSKNYLH